jgi:hypothetical protein
MVIKHMIYLSRDFVGECKNEMVCMYIRSIGLVKVSQKAAEYQSMNRALYFYLDIILG